MTDTSAGPPPPTERSATEGGGRRWLRPTVRVRVLTAVLLLAALGMALAGGTTYQVQRQAIEARMLDDLTIGVEEFRTLAQQGIDPDTGAPFQSACPLIYTALQRMALAPHEGMVGLVNGELWRVAPVTVTLRLEEDPEFLAAVTGRPPDTAVRVRELTTSRTTYRYVAIPVTAVGADSDDAGDPGGAVGDASGELSSSCLRAEQEIPGGPGDAADPEDPQAPEDDEAENGAAGAAEVAETGTGASEAPDGTSPDDATVGNEVGTLVLAVDWGGEHAELADTYRTFAVVALGALLLVGVVGWMVVGRSLLPVRELRATAQRISDSDLSDRIPVRGRDDLSDLARTVNAMLDRLEVAFSSQRRLLDDVGHELRTPLTIVRGHLELMDADDAEEVAGTRALALDEIDRMHRMVDDLVTLARVERPDFIRTRPTDVELLTDEVLEKVHALGDRVWTVDSRAGVTARIDPQRITQAWLQLAANAVKFSDAGSTVAIGSAVRDDAVHLWVRDEGAGIDPADQAHIFERFHRGRTGRRTEGAGLGLAIVKAIATAHGGSVEVDSTAGVGSTFTIILPVGPSQDDGPPDQVAQRPEDRDHRPQDQEVSGR